MLSFFMFSGHSVMVFGFYICRDGGARAMQYFKYEERSLQARSWELGSGAAVRGLTYCGREIKLLCGFW